MRPYDAITKKMLAATHWERPTPSLAFSGCPLNLTQALEVARRKVAVEGDMWRNKSANALDVWRNKAASALLRWISSRYAQFAIGSAGGSSSSRAGRGGEGAVLPEDDGQSAAIWAAVRALVAPAADTHCPPNAVTCTSDTND